MPSGDVLDFSERFEVEHRAFLSEFEDKVWPMYQQWGYQKDTALMAWLVLAVKHVVEDFLDRVEVSNGDDEGGTPGVQ